MAISNEEVQLRDETRNALLTAIKQAAESATENAVNHDQVAGEALRHLAEAYVLVIGTAKPPAKVGGIA